MTQEGVKKAIENVLTITRPCNKREVFLLLASLNLLNAAIKKKEYKRRLSYGLIKTRASRLFEYLITNGDKHFVERTFYNATEQCLYFSCYGLQFSFHCVPQRSRSLQQYIKSTANAVIPWSGIRLQPVASDIFRTAILNFSSDIDICGQVAEILKKAKSTSKVQKPMKVVKRNTNHGMEETEERTTLCPKGDDGKVETIGEIPIGQKEEPADYFSIISEGNCSEFALPLVLGRSYKNNAPVTMGMEYLPHLIVAANDPCDTESYVSELLKSLMCKHSPDMLQISMMVSKNSYAGIPAKYIIGNTLVKDVDDTKQTLQTLNDIMTKRYDLLNKTKSRNIYQYNMKFREKLGHITDPMNYIVVLIDDFSDFRKGGIKDIVFPICSLAQLGRATGIHLILATSDVSSSCIDGSIKTNFPARIALKLKDEKDYKFLFDDAGLTLNTAELRVQLDRKGKVRDLKRIFCIK